MQRETEELLAWAPAILGGMGLWIGLSYLPVMGGFIHIILISIAFLISKSVGGAVLLIYICSNIDTLSRLIPVIAILGIVALIRDIWLFIDNKKHEKDNLNL